MLSSKFLKDIMAEAYPIIQRQLEDAQVIASFRELVTANGGDWSALKALMKAHVEDSLDDSGEGKRVKKILEKADSSNAYAEMLGLANMNEKNFISDDEDDEQPDSLAALRSNPALSIVDVSNLKNKGSNAQTIPAAAEAQRSTPVDHVGSSGEAPIQSAPQAGSDLTEAPAYDQGQVATYSEPQSPQPAAQMLKSDTAVTAQRATSPDRVEGIEDGQPVQVADKSVEAKASATPAENSEPAREGGSQSPDVMGRDMGAAAPSSGEAQRKYAEPGVIVWETTPPEGVERGAISMAFGTMGQDPTVIVDDLEKADAAPIVKKGKVILDGWARYVKARELGVEYPVVQYAGTDILTDIIKLNVEGRILSEDQKRKIAASLARQEPSRKDDIYRAFELWMEPA